MEVIRSVIYKRKYRDCNSVLVYSNIPMGQHRIIPD